MKDSKPPASHQEPPAVSKRERWARYQERHAKNPLGGSIDRLGQAADFWLDAWKEHASAGVGWAQQIVNDREYPLERVVPDVLTFSSGLIHTAQGWFRFVSGADKNKPKP